MAGYVKWPEWWQWEMTMSDHLLRRMVKRDFNEVNLRMMLSLLFIAL